MNARLIFLLIAVATVLVGTSLKPILRAQPAPVGDAATAPASSRPPFSAGGLARRAFGRLHLSAEQKQSGLAVLRSHRPAIKGLLDRLATERTALQTLSKAPAVDEAAVRAQSARVAAVEADLAVQRAYLAHDLRALATPEQLQTLDRMQAESTSRRAMIVQRISDWIADS